MALACVYLLTFRLVPAVPKIWEKKGEKLYFDYSRTISINE